MQDENRESTFSEAQEQLDQVLRQRAALDSQVLELRRQLHSLQASGDLTPGVVTTMPMPLSPGLTQEIRNILRGSAEALSVDEVLEAYRSLGHDTARYHNPRSCVQTILTRLVRYGEAEAVLLPQGQKQYRIRSLLRHAG